MGPDTTPGPTELRVGTTPMVVAPEGAKKIKEKENRHWNNQRQGHTKRRKQAPSGDSRPDRTDQGRPGHPGRNQRDAPERSRPKRGRGTPTHRQTRVGGRPRTARRGPENAHAASQSQVRATRKPQSKQEKTTLGPPK